MVTVTGQGGNPTNQHVAEAKWLQVKQRVASCLHGLFIRLPTADRWEMVTNVERRWVATGVALGWWCVRSVRCAFKIIDSGKNSLHHFLWDDFFNYLSIAVLEMLEAKCWKLEQNSGKMMKNAAKLKHCCLRTGRMESPSIRRDFSQSVGPSPFKIGNNLQTICKLDMGKVRIIYLQGELCSCFVVASCTSDLMPPFRNCWPNNSQSWCRWMMVDDASYC